MSKNCVIRHIFLFTLIFKSDIPLFNINFPDTSYIRLHFSPSYNLGLNAKIRFIHFSYLICTYPCLSMAIQMLNLHHQCLRAVEQNRLLPLQWQYWVNWLLSRRLAWRHFFTPDSWSKLRSLLLFVRWQARVQNRAKLARVMPCQEEENQRSNGDWQVLLLIIAGIVMDWPCSQVRQFRFQLFLFSLLRLWFAEHFWQARNCT